jgi:ParB family chromosome partitioning protein
MEHKALGKGLSALIPDQPASVDNSVRVLMLKVEDIHPNPYQPRVEFKQEELDDLANSIKEKGVIQPLLVRPKPGGYELIAGERRLRAAKSLGLSEVPVIVKDVDDRDSLELALIENVQRSQLNAIEEARAYQYMMDKFNMTQEEVGQVLGKSRVSVANVLRLLKLTPEVQDEIKTGRISFGHGKALLEVEDPNRQRFLTQIAISKSLSVRELEGLIKDLRPKRPKLTVRVPGVDPVTAVLGEELQQLLGTKVRIVKNKKRGHIIVEFYSQEDLERIVSKLRGDKSL